ncbi:MAG TPA: SidE phosphodiesterase domain-containing protein [Candidatus Nitrosotenuis sp.]|jgi:hypothetical protein|nr:SidE phosphodiesterase domain-containing protein [Candidatus Nitrosotenuis sp.]
MTIRKASFCFSTFVLCVSGLIFGGVSPQTSQAHESLAQERRVWGYTIADGVSDYFLKTYEALAEKYTIEGQAVGGFFRPVKSEGVSPDKIKVERTIEGKKYVVPRPQHGIAHGLRQGFLVVDIINILNSINLKDLKPNSDLPASAWSNIEFVQDMMRADSEGFLKNVQAAASFLKSGRVDESDGKAGEYQRGIQRDATNYYKFALQHEDIISLNERRMFAAALSYGWGLSPNKELLKLDEALREYDEFSLLMGNITVGAHRFDLGRLPPLDYVLPNKKTGGAHIFNGDENAYHKYPLIRIICDNLWERAREYLIATGDKHYEDMGWVGYDDKFFIQAQDPHTIIDALEAARANSKIKNFFVPLQSRKWFNPSEQ